MSGKHDEVPKEVREYFRQFGKFGREGGKAAAKNLTKTQREKRAREAGKASGKNLTPEQRKERARLAAAARWAKKEKTDRTDRRASNDD